MAAPMSWASRHVDNNRSLPVALNAMRMALTDVDKIGTESDHVNVKFQRVGSSQVRRHREGNVGTHKRDVWLNYTRTPA